MSLLTRYRGTSRPLNLSYVKLMQSKGLEPIDLLYEIDEGRECCTHDLPTEVELQIYANHLYAEGYWIENLVIDGVVFPTINLTIPLHPMTLNHLAKKHPDVYSNP